MDERLLVGERYREELLECLEEEFFFGDQIFFSNLLKRLITRARSFPILSGSSDSQSEAEPTSEEEWREAFALRA